MSQNSIYSNFDRTSRAFKSNRPKISPSGVQNEEIENPQTLPEYRSG